MNTRDTLDTHLNVLENFEPIVPEEFKESEFLMLGNLMPSVCRKKVLDQMTKKTKISGFGYYEFLDGSFYG